MGARDILQIIERVSYRNWRFRGYAIPNVGVAVFAEFDAPEFPSGILALQESRRWLIPYTATEDDIVPTCLLLVLTAEEHEAREWFAYDGEQVFGPHQPLVPVLPELRRG